MTASTASHAGTFRIPVGGRTAAERLARVLDIEAQETPERSRVQVEARDDVVELTVEADDARSLRAAMNSILRLAVVAVDLEDGESFKP